MVAGSLRCTLILTLSCLAAAAQIAQPQGPDPPGEAPLPVPDAERSKINFLTLGLRVSSDFDDNALNSDQNRQGDLVTSIQPRVGWRVFRPRLEGAVDYAPGLIRNQSFSALDSLSHLLDSGFQVKLTKRLRLFVHESFLKSANPFDQLQAFEAATDSAARTAPNDTAPVAPAEVRTEHAQGDMVYALSAHSAVGVGSEFFNGKYSLPSGVQSPGRVLQNSSSTVGHGYYMRQVTRHQWTGLDYYVRKSTFNGGQSWSLVHSLVYTHTITPSRSMTLSFFIGPERSVTRSVTGTFDSLTPVFSGHQSTWHWSGGVTGRWVGMRTSITAVVSKKISDDGVLGAVELSRTSAELSRQLGRQWTAHLLASYDVSKAVADPGALSYFSAAGWLTRALGSNLSLQFQCWREHLAGKSSLPSVFLADHNRISVSLIYELGYPLGR